MNKPKLIILGVILSVSLGAAYWQARAALGGPVISHVQIITTEVARYERFEVQFDVQTVAVNLDLPYDPNPPSGVEQGIGVTVNAEFSHDGWVTKHVQPAFYNQPYTLTVQNNRDHLTPNGAPNWVVRFAPQEAGSWEFRLCVTDSLGTTYYPDLGNPALAFSVTPTSSNPYTRHGFLQASQTDRRYFEFSDGTPFVGVGFNDTFTATTVMGAKMDAYEQNKLNFIRIWLSGASINGSQWTSWTSHFLNGNISPPEIYFNTNEENTYDEADFSMILDNSNPCFFSDHTHNGIPVEPNTTYSVSARVKPVGIGDPVVLGEEYGFVVKQDGWIDEEDKELCTVPGQGDFITTPVISSTGWITVTGSYTTDSLQHWLDYLYLARQNTVTGTVYIDEVRLWRADDPNEINLLREPNANSHLYFDPMNAAQWDHLIRLAEEHGVYIKLVIDEKNEWLRNHIDASGNSVSDGSNNNFYAAPDTKVRWLQEAWWRYIIARWGYSTAIHSFEYINEGDPNNTAHYEAANSMACYFDQQDPSHHMVTTSFWSGFPNAEFWSNQCIDYADIHSYISTGWGEGDNLMPSWLASLFPLRFTETDPAYIHSGNASVHITATTVVDNPIAPRGMVLKEPGEWILRYWMKADDFKSNCSAGLIPDGGMQRLHWRVRRLDGSLYKEGVTPSSIDGTFTDTCTSLGGTYEWRQFSSQYDYAGNEISSTFRIIIPGNAPYALSLRVENFSGAKGMAWIDDVELVDPNGRVQPVIGQFDITPMDEDTAWYNYAYAYVWGGGSLVGHKPLVRGEAGIDYRDEQKWRPELWLDTDGIWLHNNIWAQVNGGGMTDLFWWANETIPQSIYYHYLTFRNFMEDIPLNNGHYKDIVTQVSDTSLRAWGQQDEINGRIHLWIQNKQHTWTAVISGTVITPITGTIAILNVPAGNYDVQWWNTYTVSNPVSPGGSLVSNGTLTLTLPASLADDVAVKIERANTPPSVNAGIDQTVFVSESVSITATFTDTDPGDTHTATIDWGDGSLDAGIVDEEEKTVTGTHIYSSSASFVVTVTVADTQGGIGSDTALIQVNEEPPDDLFADGFESGNFVEWTKSYTDSGRLSVDAAAAMNGSIYGMQALLNGTTKTIYVIDTTPDAEQRYGARFYFDPNSMSMNGAYPYILFAQQSNGTVVVAISLTAYNNSYYIRAATNQDTGGKSTDWILLTDEPHYLEFDWQAASSSGVHDGHLTFWVDGNQKGIVTGLDNDERHIDTLKLGAVGSLSASMLGTWYFDDFVSRNNGYYIGAAPTPLGVGLPSTRLKVMARSDFKHLHAQAVG